MKKVNFNELMQEVREAFTPIEVSRVDGASIRMAKIHGEYRWHVHPDEDEFFFVLKGELIIETKEETFVLKEGEGIKIPKRTPHRSKANVETFVLLFEPTRTNTYGVPV